jgi:hypothetical protein
MLLGYGSVADQNPDPLDPYLDPDSLVRAMF